MLYAVVRVLDQTVGFLDEHEGWTTKHPEALLFDTREAADKTVAHYDSKIPTHWPNGEPITEDQRMRFTSWVEEVEDEETWRAQEDTW